MDDNDPIFQQRVAARAAEMRAQADATEISKAGYAKHGQSWVDGVEKLNQAQLNDFQTVAIAKEVAGSKVADVMHHIAHDPDTAARLAKLTPAARAAEFGRIADKLTSQSAPAPEPARSSAERAVARADAKRAAEPPKVEVDRFSGFVRTGTEAPKQAVSDATSDEDFTAWFNNLAAKRDNGRQGK